MQFEWQEYLDAAAGRKPMALRKERRGSGMLCLSSFEAKAGTPVVYEQCLLFTNNNYL
jgi:hypothetical protein